MPQKETAEAESRDRLHCRILVYIERQTNLIEANEWFSMWSASINPVSVKHKTNVHMFKHLKTNSELHSITGTVNIVYFAYPALKFLTGVQCTSSRVWTFAYEGLKTGMYIINYLTYKKNFDRWILHNNLQPAHLQLWEEPQLFLSL